MYDVGFRVYRLRWAERFGTVWGLKYRVVACS